jgi:hypothetical protein
MLFNKQEVIYLKAIRTFLNNFIINLKVKYYLKIIISYWAFSMPDYGFYQDEGVKGADPSQVSKNAKIKGQQAPNSRFKFKRRIPSAPFEQWAKFRNIRLRDAKGKFAKGNYKSIGYIIAKNVWARGIKPSLFFTKPFEAGYKKYIDTDLIKAFGDDIETLIDYTITNK